MAEPAAEHAADPAADDVADIAASDPVPEVGISMTTYRGVSLPPTDSLPTSEPASSQPTAPSQSGPPAAGATNVRDNVPLRDALAALPPQAEPAELVKAARHLLQGHLFVRVKGNAKELIATNAPIPWGVTKVGDETLVLVYSSGRAFTESVQSDGGTDTSAVMFPSLTLLARVLAGEYAGIVVDPASGTARLTLRRPFLERALKDADPKVALKSLLTAPRTPQTPALIGEAMASAPLFVAVGNGEGSAPGIAEVRTQDGTRLVQVFSHPLEVVALGRGDRPMPFPAPQLGKALRDNPELGGVLLDAAGPWAQLGRDDLAPVIAIAAA